MGEPRIEIYGEDAEEVGRELQALLEAEFGEQVQRVPEPEPSSAEPPQKVDPWVVAAVLLTIPQTIVAVMDIAKRIELTQKVKRILTWVKGRKGSKAQIALLSPKGKRVDLEGAEPGEVVDALVEKDKDP